MQIINPILLIDELISTALNGGGVPADAHAAAAAPAVRLLREHGVRTWGYRMARNPDRRWYLVRPAQARWAAGLMANLFIGGATAAGGIVDDNRNEIYMQHEIAALRTSQRWATLGIVIVILLALAGLVWAVDHYFGEVGVRVLLMTVGLVALLAIIYLMVIGVSAVFGRQAMEHHDNVLQGLIAFQRADDYGEVARSVATGISGAVRSGAALDARVLQVANQIARQQQAQLADSQRQQPPAPTWAMLDDAEDAGVIRRIE